TIECAIRFRTRSLSGQTKRDAETSERRSQLVRDVAKQTLLSFNHRLQTLGHRIEVLTQLPDFITTFGKFPRNARAEIAFSQLVCRCPEFQNRRCEITREPVTKDTADNEHYEQSQSQTL